MIAMAMACVLCAGNFWLWLAGVSGQYNLPQLFPMSVLFIKLAGMPTDKEVAARLERMRTAVVHNKPFVDAILKYVKSVRILCVCTCVCGPSSLVRWPVSLIRSARARAARPPAPQSVELANRRIERMSLDAPMESSSLQDTGRGCVALLVELCKEQSAVAELLKEPEFLRVIGDMLSSKERETAMAGQTIIMYLAAPQAEWRQQLMQKGVHDKLLEVRACHMALAVAVSSRPHSLTPLLS
jgi:hypothetical protein